MGRTTRRKKIHGKALGIALAKRGRLPLNAERVTATLEGGGGGLQKRGLGEGGKESIGG